MQFLHKDNLLNFGMAQNSCTLSIDNAMQAKSFIIILCALLLQDKRLRLNHNKKLMIAGSIFVLGIFYFFSHGMSGLMVRWPTWVDSVRLSLKHPFVGYGLGEFKVLFSNISPIGVNGEGRWLTAHNFFIQLFFETGIIGLGIAIAYIVRLFCKCSGMLILGLLLIGYSMMVHFPDRQISTVLLLILFMALCDHSIKTDNFFEGD